MGTSIFFGNRRGCGLQLKPGDLARIGIKTFGPVLSGEASVFEARERVVREAERRAGETESDWFLRSGKTD